MSQLIALIGGTGVGEKLAGSTKGEVLEIDTPFGLPSAPLVRTKWEGIDLVFLPRHGHGHVYPPTSVPYRANIWALKSIGVTHIIASGAVGTLQEEIRPRDLVIPDQVIDRTSKRVSTFFDRCGIAAHVEFAHPFCGTLRSILLSAAEKIDVTTHDGGTYVCMEGPAFSTIAESRLHRSWGGSLIGMTCMPEAKLAREAEICYAHVSLPTDYDCWKPQPSGATKHELLKEIMGNAAAVTESSIALIQAALKSMAATPPADCSCQHALEIAIWSDKSKIGDELKRELAPIIARHLK